MSAIGPLTYHRSNTAGGTQPVDLLLLMTASENDAPKTAELLRAGADLSVKVLGLLSIGDIIIILSSTMLLILVSLNRWK